MKIKSPFPWLPCYPVTLVLAVTFAGCVASNTTPAVYTPAAHELE